MASLDLSAAFDVVNIDLLLKRLVTVGLPDDIAGLMEIWLRNRMFYVQVADHTSIFHEINSGTIQGSILGPILYAIYVAPLYDISKFQISQMIISHLLKAKTKFRACTWWKLNSN